MRVQIVAILATIAAMLVLPIIGSFVVQSSPEAQVNFDGTLFNVDQLQSSFDLVASSLNNLLIGIFVVFGFLVGFSKERLANLGPFELIFGAVFILSQMISGYFGVLARMRFFENIQLGSMDYEIITNILRLQGFFIYLSFALCIGFFILFFFKSDKSQSCAGCDTIAQQENQIAGE